MSVRFVEASMAGRSQDDTGGSVLMIERTRRRRRPDWSVWMLGWQSSYFHVVVVDGMSERLMGRQADLGEWDPMGSSSMCHQGLD